MSKVVIVVVVDGGGRGGEVSGAAVKLRAREGSPTHTHTNTNPLQHNYTHTTLRYRTPAPFFINTLDYQHTLSILIYVLQRVAVEGVALRQAARVGKLR